ncbi:hypothetical protein [Paramuribaculum intestinale]|uniref:hypothetical protein n=1 Tax=Paramuribaculum intestinale TaxID=2094151 RepID=UPI0025B1D552|nr:hypothetical protein [Paramuribaculum intestinale]
MKAKNAGQHQKAPQQARVTDEFNNMSEFFSNSKKSFFQIAKIPIESRHKKGDRQKLTDRLSLRSTTIKHLHRAAYQVALA